MRLNYAIVFVRDMKRAVTFYRDVIGLPLKFESPSWTEFATDGATLALHAGDEAAGRCRPGLNVPDLDEFHRKMTSIEVTLAEAAAVHAALPDPKVLTVDAVRFAIAAGMEQVKDAALADVDRFVAGDSPSDPARYVHWLERIRGEYADWLARAVSRQG